MNNYILSELARKWRVTTEHGHLVGDGSEASKLFSAERKGYDKACLDCSKDIEQLMKMFGALGE